MCSDEQYRVDTSDIGRMGEMFHRVVRQRCQHDPADERDRIVCMGNWHKETSFNLFVNSTSLSPNSGTVTSLESPHLQSGLPAIDGEDYRSSDFLQIPK